MLRGLRFANDSIARIKVFEVLFSGVIVWHELALLSTSRGFFVAAIECSRLLSVRRLCVSRAIRTLLMHTASWNSEL